MSSSEPVTSSPEELVFTFKQGDEESFKDAWSRIFTSYRKTEPQMTLSLLLSNFYFGLMVRYRYALDTLVGGDFLHCNGDQAFNAIKKLVASHDSANNFDSALTSIYSRLNNLEISTSRLNDNYCHVRNRLEQILVNSKLHCGILLLKLLSVIELFMPTVILCLNFALCLKAFINL